MKEKVKKKTIKSLDIIIKKLSSQQNFIYENFQNKVWKKKRVSVELKSIYRSNLSPNSNKSPNFKDFFSLKNRYSRLIRSRFFSYLFDYKKKYTGFLPIDPKKKRKIQRCFFFFIKRRIKLKVYRRKKLKNYKRYVWRRKKKKLRYKKGLFYFLRRRPRMLFQFYVPRHLEVNYKTFSLIYIGGFDLKSSCPRVSYRLNLRRLVTFLAL